MKILHLIHYMKLFPEALRHYLPVFLFIPFLHLYAQTNSFEDMSFSKGTFFGTAKNDSYLLHVAVDAQGYVYGTGLCTDIPTTPGVVQPTCGGQFDIMVFKMDPTMTKLIWATYIGGSDNESGGSISVNSGGEVFVSGYTFSKNFPVTNQADRAFVANGQVSVFALKLSSDGSRLIYSRILGSAAPIQQQSQNASKGANICINPRDEAFVLATMPSGTAYTLTNNGFQRVAAGGFECALTKLDVNGNVAYSTLIGGSGSDVARDICYARGKVYICGATNSPNFPRNTGRIPAGVDAFVTLVDDINPPRVRKTFVFGSTGNDAAISLSYDAHANRMLLTGSAEYGNIPTTTVIQPNQITGGFVAALDTGITRIQFLSMLGTGITPTSITAKSNSTVYIAGYVVGTVPVTPNALQPNSRGDLDGVLISLDSTGSKVRYGSYIGGSSPDYSAAKVLLFESGCITRVIFGITTHSTNFPSTSDAYQPQKLNGAEDQGALVLFSSMAESPLSMTTKNCAKEYTFNVKPACPPLDVIWDFGDGTIIRGQYQQTHMFRTSGLYHVNIKLIYDEPDTIIVKRDINVVGAPGVNAGPDQTICTPGQRVQLRASGGTRYFWSPGKLFTDSALAVQDVYPKQTTTYYVHSRDSSGCESSDSVTINVIDVHTVNRIDTSICEGQSTIIHLNTTAQVQWLPAPGLGAGSGNNVVVNPTRNQLYTAVISQGICSDTALVMVTVHAQPHLTILPVSTLCFNHSATIQAQAFGQYVGDTVGMKVQWTPLINIANSSTLRPTVNPTKTQTYKCTITTRHGCTRTDSVKVTVQNSKQLQAIGDTLVCSGGGIRLWATGGVSFRWTPTTGLSNPNSASPICTATQSTRYTVISTNGVCTDTASMMVTVGQKPACKALGDTTVCENQRVCLRVSNPDAGLSYTWSPAADFENAIGATVYAKTRTTKNYIVTAHNATACVAFDTVKVTVNNSLPLSASTGPSVCEGDQITIRINSAHDPSYQFSFSPNDGVYSPIDGTYTVVARPNRSYIIRAQRETCVGTTVVSIPVRALPQFTLTPDTAVCKGNSVQLRARSSSNAIRYSWTDGSANHAYVVGSTTNSFIRTAQLDSDRVFTVIATENGCTTTKTVRVKTLELPHIIIPQASPICIGEGVALKVSAKGMKTVSWSPSVGLSNAHSSTVIASPLSTTQYTVSVQDSAGCSSDEQVTVVVKPNTPISLSVSSSYSRAGDTVALTVSAMSAIPVKTALSMDVVCEAGIFVPVDLTKHQIVQGQRVMHIETPEIDLNAKPSSIAVISGSTMVETSASSVVSIESANVLADICPLVKKTPGIIAVASCFYNGRSVALFDSLRATVSPNPLADHSTLHIHGSMQASISIELFDGLGRLIKQWTHDHNALDSSLELDLTDLAQGIYTFNVHSATELFSLRCAR